MMAQGPSADGSNAGLMGGPQEEPPNAVDAEMDVLSNGKYTMAKKNRKSLKDLAKSGVGAASPTHQTQAEGGIRGPEGSSPSADLVNRLKKSLFGEAGPASEDGDPGGQDLNSNTNLPPPSVSSATSASSPRAPASSQADEGAGAAATGAGAAQLSPQTSLLKRAVQSALRRVCEKPKIPIPQPLGKVSRVAVFPIESPNLTGYLVLGVPSGKKVQDYFLRLCEAAIREDFTSMKVPAELQDGFWIELPQVEFSTWSEKKAEFNLLVPHENSQVGAAFFSKPSSIHKVESANEHGMMSIGLDNISTDQPVTFKAYLHLRKNKKYFLYLRNGRHLQPKQKERLKIRSVQEVFMKSVDAENLRSYLATTYLTELIKDAA
jgi:hypothetical protein